MKLKFKILAIVLAFIGLSLNINYSNAKEYYNNIPLETKKLLESEEFKKSELESMAKVDQKGKVLQEERSPNFWSYQDGLICVVDSKSSGFNHGHAGIVGTVANPGCTIEAQPNGGVQALSAYWPGRYKGKKLVQAGVNGTGVYQDYAAALWAESQIGKPYNWNFFNTSTRNSFYCSQLVWAAYHDCVGVDLANGGHTWITPFELVESGKVIINYYRG